MAELRGSQTGNLMVMAFGKRFMWIELCRSKSKNLGRQTKEKLRACVVEKLCSGHEYRVVALIR